MKNKDDRTDKDYENFVARMGSFGLVLDVDTGLEVPPKKNEEEKNVKKIE